MLTRKEPSSTPVLIPDNASQNVVNVINETYAKEIKAFAKSVEFYGQTSSDELLLVISILSIDDENSIPTSFFLSTDINANSDFQKYFDKMIDLFGLLLDSYFNNQCQIDYSPTWGPISEENDDYFYKINRENIKLTIQADKILSN